MKSYQRSSALRLLLFLLPVLALGADPATCRQGRCSSALPESASLLAWLNAARAAAGAPRLETDPVLEATARDYAARLLSLRRLSHRDPEGGNALARYRAHGGTSLRVGEVLGSGPALETVQAAWWNSPDHHPVLLRPEWTHLGLGRAAGEAGNVWVLLFAARPISGLSLTPQEGGGWSLEGIVPETARAPVLLSGPRRLAAEEWEPASGRFRYHLPPEAEAGYHRLGYETASGELRISDAFHPGRLPRAVPPTSGPGTGFPED